ncbi:pyruvate, water dikinase regulatory protein [Candidatus Mesenet endosymbiont of Agriotes lineatus]|uniref:pyruvate, water dikinase regulatory protein n=1 Tax=Candidatus Mesenet endosymbiont of Agriotes lineatus TaxID=3077948 RepID=UPI0030CBEE10
MLKKILNLHLVSDSTGETVASVARAAVQHFNSIDARENVWSLVQDKQQIDKILGLIKKDEHNFVICTITNDKLRNYLKESCRTLKVPYVAILSHIMREISSYLNVKKDSFLNLHNSLSDNYYERMDAINYTINHDDGQNIYDIDEADVVLVGVSRTSKSPTSIYLAYRGYRVANLPFVDEVPFYVDLKKIKNTLVIGLTIDIDRLIQIRKNRLISIKDINNKQYIGTEQVEKEILEAEAFFSNNKWPIIDVTQRSIEEIAAIIMQYFHKMQKIAD